jgi:hypothetical protein
MLERALEQVADDLDVGVAVGREASAGATVSSLTTRRLEKPISLGS